jgi:hypothetical protein
MKKIIMRSFLTLLLALAFISTIHAQADPWKKEQVLPTKDLAAQINANKDLPLILNVGPMDNIKTAVNIGAVNTDAGIVKLKNMVANTPKNKAIVIYCGCCSYINCVNIRPAFQTLQKMGFKNLKVLDIPEGFREDWVAKGYPVEE